MQLHQLQKISGKKSARRVGRGGKRGTTSGRGQKGQRSRSGRRIRPAIRDLIQRTPKRRGFRNKPKSEKPFIVSLMNIAEKIKPLAKSGMVEVSRDTLVQLALVPKSHRGEVKVLGKGATTLALAMKGLKVSSGARAAIEKAGGKVM